MKNYKSIYDKTNKRIPEIKRSIKKTLDKFKEQMGAVLQCEWSEDGNVFTISRRGDPGSVESKVTYISIDIFTGPILITRFDGTKNIPFSSKALDNFLTDLMKDYFYVHATSAIETQKPPQDSPRVVSMEKFN